MAAPDRSMDSGGTPARGRDSHRNARHSYLVGRLQNRQITMEEAAELFTIMQGLLQTSEAARLAMMRLPPPPRAPMGVSEPRERPPAGTGGGGDELLLVGLLAMGAGAGLLAAMTKRIQDGTTPAGSDPNSRSRSGTSSQKG